MRDLLATHFRRPSPSPSQKTLTLTWRDVASNTFVGFTPGPLDRCWAHQSQQPHAAGASVECRGRGLCVPWAEAPDAHEHAVRTDF